MPSVFINTVFITSSPRVADIVICLRFSMVLHSMSSEAREYLHVRVADVQIQSVSLRRMP